MAEKTTTKKATATKATATKATAEKKAAAPKKACAKKTVAKAPAFVVSAENVGFKAGDVYQALAKAENGLTIAEVAKQANIAAEEVLLGLGWLLKEGKVKAGENDKVALA